jgi:hypothetical protein
LAIPSLCFFQSVGNILLTSFREFAEESSKSRKARRKQILKTSARVITKYSGAGEKDVSPRR